MISDITNWHTCVSNYCTLVRHQYVVTGWFLLFRAVASPAISAVIESDLVIRALSGRLCPKSMSQSQHANYAQHPDLVGLRVLVTGTQTGLKLVSVLTCCCYSYIRASHLVLDPASVSTARVRICRKLLRYWQGRRTGICHAEGTQQQYNYEDMRDVTIREKTSSRCCGD